MALLYITIGFFIGLGLLKMIQLGYPEFYIDQAEEFPPSRIFVLFVCMMAWPVILPFALMIIAGLYFIRLLKL